MKKEYLEPIIEIEYYEDVILCLDINNSTISPSMGDADIWGGDDLEVPNP